MKKNVFRHLNVIISMFTLCAMPVSAQTDDAEIHKIEEVIISYMNTDTSASVYSVADSAQTDSLFHVRGDDLDSLQEYQKCSISYQDYAESGLISALIDQDVYYVVPYENNKTAGVITLQNNENGVFQVSESTSGNSIPSHIVLDRQFVSDAVSRIFSEETALNIRYLDAGIGMKLAYFVDENVEYVIPFFKDSDEMAELGMLHGAVYTAPEFMGWIEEMESAAVSSTGEILFGGPSISFDKVKFKAKPYALTGYGSSIPLWCYPAILALIISGFTIFIVQRRKKKLRSSCN